MTRRTFEEQEGDPILINDNERILYIGRDQPIRISSGHRILHHEGKCSRPHGHNYEVSVKVAGNLTDKGWIADKADITDIISHWDHRFLLEEGDPLIDAFEASGDSDAVIVLDHPPTAEVMSLVLEEQLMDELSENVATVDVTIQETSELSTGASI